jgi:hypothetical protein
LDPLGKQGHKVKKCCGGNTYEDNAGNQNMYGCCNDRLYTVNDSCCENGQIVAKVPIWITRVPNFENDYIRDIAGGWDTVCPLSAFGWNLLHALICLDGQLSGCIGPNDVADKIEDQDYIVDHSIQNGTEQIRSKKIMVCPKRKQDLKNLIGTPFDHDYIFNNCQHFVQQQGGGIW